MHDKTIQVNISEAKDLVSIVITSQSPIDNFEISAILDNISKDIGNRNEKSGAV